MNRHFSLLLCILIFAGTQILAQDGPTPQKDSTTFVSKDSLIFLDSTLIMPAEVDTLKRGPSLEDLIYKGRTYSLEANQIMLELQDNLDTTQFAEQIPIMERTVNLINERVKHEDTKFNFRYVTALTRLLRSVREKNNELDGLLQARLDRLHDLDSLLGTIKHDDFFQYKIRDSLLLPTYSSEIEKLKGNLNQLDSAIYRQELQAARYQAKLSTLTISTLELQRYVDNNRSILEKNLLKKEINFIWESASIASPKTIFQITLDSFKLNYLFLIGQFRAETFITVLACLILIGIFLYVSHTLKRVREDKEYGSIILQRLKLLSTRTFAAVMVAVLPLIFFMFDIGSVAVLTFFMYLLVIFSSILIQVAFPAHVFFKWLAIVAVFLFFSISNLYWEIAYQERFYFQIGNLVILYLLWRARKTYQSEDQKETELLKKLGALTMIFLTLAFVCNVFGRYSLAKLLSVAGAAGFVHAVTLYFFIKVIMEIIYLIAENKKSSDAFTSYLDFQAIQSRIRGLFTFLAIVFWVDTLLHNLALSDNVYDTITEFLEKERTLGATTFEFGSILLFVGLIYVSYVLSNNIAYFASLKDQKNSANRTKRLGSSILLIRLAIFTAGFLIAATAAQIPLDKITIVLGALSVGIGFGLQTIINNLVSGVILAFERPIQIGDDIEVGNMSGSVKEVGIRASKILAYDGAEVIIPNGDLLSQSLINWTLSDRRRRVELLIGVGYDSDMQRVKSLLEEILQRDRILKNPKPRVLMQNFGESSVDFRILFWIESMDFMLDIRNEVMGAIFQIFKDNNIELPFPKQDLYIKSMPEESAKKEDKKNPPTSDSGDNSH